MIPKASLFAAALMAAPFAVPAAAQDIAVGPFKGVGLSSGGRVTLREGATQRVRLIKGSLDCTFIGIERGSAQSLQIKPKRGGHCPQNYALEVEVTAPHFNALAVDSGGAMKAEGAFHRVGELSVAVDSGGSIDLRAIPADQVNAAVDSGGAIKVRADGTLNAAVDSGGKITYWGNPKVRSIVDDGGSIVRGKDS